MMITDDNGESRDDSEDEEFVTVRFSATANLEGKRLDVALTEYLKTLYHAQVGESPEQAAPTRAKVARWIEEGRVEVDGRVTDKAGARLRPDAQLAVTIPPVSIILEITPDGAVAINPVFEDEHVLVLNKQANLPVHPGAGWGSGTLVNGLVHYLGDSLKQIGDSLRPGIVHRLDKDTTGLLVVAKSELALQSLIGQLQPPRTMKRRYLALTASLPRQSDKGTKSEKGSGVIDLPIGRHPTDRKRMTVRPDGKPSQTLWRVKEELRHGVLLELELATGRTHQIRVHLQSSGAPVLGDPIYGSIPPALPPSAKAALRSFGRQALHAFSLSFQHPVTGELIACEAPLPEDFERFKKVLGG